ADQIDIVVLNVQYITTVWVAFGLRFSGVAVVILIVSVPKNLRFLREVGRIKHVCFGVSSIPPVVMQQGIAFVAPSDSRIPSDGFCDGLPFSAEGCLDLKYLVSEFNFFGRVSPVKSLHVNERGRPVCPPTERAFARFYRHKAFRKVFDKRLFVKYRN